MVFTTSAVAMVVKNLKGGGRMWNKPWGAKRLTRAQKANRRAEAERADAVRATLREAAALEPLPSAAAGVGGAAAAGGASAVGPIRLERPLAAWRARQMAGHVRSALSAGASELLAAAGGARRRMGTAAAWGGAVGGGGGSGGGGGVLVPSFLAESAREGPVVAARAAAASRAAPAPAATPAASAGVSSPSSSERAAEGRVTTVRRARS